MRKIILNLAISLDGYIADDNGGFNWIVGEGEGSLNTEAKFDFPKFIESVDTIVMGSKAYEDAPAGTLSPYDEKKLIVATSRKLDVTPNVELVNGDVCARVLELREEDGKDIWLYGGGVVIDAFIKADVIDEYIIGIIPTVLGSGRKLFLEDNPTIKLHLKESIVDSGIVLLTYSKREA